MNLDHLEKLKIRHETSIVIFSDNVSKILRPDLPEKLNDEHYQKINIKTVIKYIPMPNYSLFREFQIVGPNLAKRKYDKTYKK